MREEVIIKEDRFGNEEIIVREDYGYQNRW